jgi:hypothetical protein
MIMMISVQFFIVYVLSEQLQEQLQKEHSVGTSTINYITNKNIKTTATVPV